jgi:methionyl-tRNA formyltransferase
VVYNLIRGCNPAPAAWTLFQGKKLQLFDARKHAFHRFGQVKGAVGAVTAVGAESVFITAQGGQIEVFKLKYGEGKKLPAPQLCAEAGLVPGAVLGV